MLKVAFFLFRESPVLVRPGLVWGTNSRNFPATKKVARISAE